MSTMPPRPSRAIARASPGGLGDAPEHDVRAPARVSLREAMAAAAHRDSIASEYATGYAIVFDTGLPLLEEALGDGAATLDAIVSLHVGLLAAVPDTLIARKAGADGARGQRRGAREVRDGARSLAEFDASLRGARQPAESRVRPPTWWPATLLAALLSGSDGCHEGAGGRGERADARASWRWPTATR